MTGVSEVTVDAGGSTGAGLRYRVEFGDGTTASEAVSRHVYDVAGTYSVTVTLTDASGRTTTTSRELVVASPLGAWLYSGYLARVRAVEVRTLTLTARDGLTVRGVLTRAGAGESAVTGFLTPDRRIRLTVERQSETLEGVLPSVMTGERAALMLAARGGPADGETLTFTPRIGEPTGPAPDAVLKMRFFSFSAPFAIKEISPIQFDGSTSRGEDLRYFIEFGDQQFTTDATAVHPINQVGQYTARLTAVDRFGRSDVETTSFEVRTLVANGWYYWWEGAGGLIRIQSQKGTAVAGTLTLYRNFDVTSFTGTADGNGDVRLALAGSDVALVGTLTLRWTGYYSNELALKYVGGPHNGETLTFHFRDNY